MRFPRNKLVNVYPLDIYKFLLHKYNDHSTAHSRFIICYHVPSDVTGLLLIAEYCLPSTAFVRKSQVIFATVPIIKFYDDIR